jgi:hypothetical protein
MAIRGRSNKRSRDQEANKYSIPELTDGYTEMGRHASRPDYPPKIIAS